MFFLVAEGEEVSSLRVAIQDLENQIEEQKHKISNTPMPLLRVSWGFSQHVTL